MKTRRIVSSLALAAAVVLGASGCSLFAPQGTLEQYAPSDGIDVNVEGVNIRNLLLVADESGENFNVVFTGVNNGTEPVLLRITFVSEDGSFEASADFDVAPGSTSFGHPDGDVAPTLVSIPDVIAGGAVAAYFEVAGGGEVNRAVPIVDGTLAEYRDYVLSAAQLRALTAEDEEADAEVGSGETVQAEPAEGDAAEGETAE